MRACRFTDPAALLPMTVALISGLALGFFPEFAQGVTTRISLSSAGAQGDQISWRSAVSADGRYVAFDSRATNLVPGDTNDLSDLFLHDRETGTTTRINVDSQGNETHTDNSFGFAASLNADGRFVAFSSRAPDLVPGDTNGPLGSDVFVHDTQTGETTRVSVDSFGGQANGESSGGTLSADGQFVAFQSRAADLVAGDANGVSDVFVHDRQSGETTRISLSSAGIEGDGASFDAVISGDARFVAFASFATNLVDNDTNDQVDIFVHDRQTGETTRVSVDDLGNQADGQSLAPAISDDGRIVAFESRASNLVVGDTNGLQDIFVHDRQTARTIRASVDSQGNQGTFSSSEDAALSSDGLFVAFATASRLTPEDTNNTFEVFVHDIQKGETTRVSVDSQGNEGDSSSQNPAISGDGQLVTFDSSASNLVPGDTNGRSDVFVSEWEPLDPPEPEPEVGLVRCLHFPLYPDAGQAVEIVAESIDADGNPIDAEQIEIFVGAGNQPHTTGTGTRLVAALPGGADENRDLTYGCRARSGTSAVFSGFHTVDVGRLRNSDWSAIPIFYNGRSDEKIDIVFFTEQDSFGGQPTGSDFQEAVYDLIWEGLFYIPWFVRNQDALNIWIAKDTAGVEPKDPTDSSKKCKKDKPDEFSKKYGFADAAGIIHTEACRDNAALKTFSTGYDLQSLQVLAHEIGHAAFSLSDEYEGNTFYFTLPDVPNLLPNEQACIASAIVRDKDFEACRPIDGGIAGRWWIFEPDYDIPGDRQAETGDLMQGTGGDICPHDADLTCRRYRVGDSEIDRMNWKVDKCDNGRC